MISVIDIFLPVIVTFLVVSGLIIGAYVVPEWVTERTIVKKYGWKRVVIFAITLSLVSGVVFLYSVL